MGTHNSKRPSFQSQDGKLGRVNVHWAGWSGLMGAPGAASSLQARGKPSVGGGRRRDDTSKTREASNAINARAAMIGTGPEAYLVNGCAVVRCRGLKGARCGVALTPPRVQKPESACGQSS